MYQPRTYRHWIRDTDLISFNVVIKETDLCISARTNLRRKALRLVSKYRKTLEKYIEQHPLFLTSMEALATDDTAPHIVKTMLEAAQEAGVGPMASVAGAIAEFVGTELSAFSPEVIVENGGDIYLKSLKKKVIGVYAGSSPLSGKIGLEINGRDTPLGICTSSGTVGHSLSYGEADAVIAIAKSATLADAAATAIGNLVKRPDDISSGIEVAKGIESLRGVVIIIGSDLGLWGEVKVCQTPL
jgi:ApbE superfamily uncharacterized protein (UPF0280 family)